MRRQLGFVEQSTDMHARRSGRGPSNGVRTRRKQPDDDSFRSPACRQNHGKFAGSPEPTAAHESLFFGWSNFQLSGDRVQQRCRYYFLRSESLPGKLCVANVATLTTADSLLLPGQVEVTAKTPGLTPLFATIGNVNSVPIYFTTCPVQSITLAVTTASSTSRTITPTIFDTSGVADHRNSADLEFVQLRFRERERRGGNWIFDWRRRHHHRLLHSAHLQYRLRPVVADLPRECRERCRACVRRRQLRTSTVYVSSDSCGTTDGCINMIVPVTSPANTVGNFIPLSATPNSLVFNGAGTTAYLGTNSSLLGSVGLASA